MKKLIRILALSAVLVLALCVPTMAADAPPSVMVNGEVVDFPDAVPQNVEGRIFIPMRAVFNVLGFADNDITWDGPTRTATAVKGDLTVNLTVGQKQVSVTKGGVTTVLETDAAAYIDAAAGRTMVPLRFVSQAAGCNVGWDQDDQTAIIDDTAAILAANKETYELMDKYLDYSQSFAEKKYAVTGGYSMDVDVMGESVKVDGDYDMLMNGMAAQFATDMTFSGNIAGEDVSDLIPNIDMDLRFDMNTGVYYLKSEALNEMMNLGISGVWYKLDMGAMMDELGAALGMDYSSLMELSKAAQELTFTQYLEMALTTLPLNDVTATTGDTLAVLNSICADSAFKKSGATYTSTIEMDGVELSLTLYGYGSSINGYAVKMNALDLVTMDVSMRNSDLKAEMKMEIPAEMGAAMSMTMDMTGRYKTTNKTPEVAPPADAGLIDLMDLMNAAG